MNLSPKSKESFSKKNPSSHFEICLLLITERDNESSQPVSDKLLKGWILYNIYIYTHINIMYVI